jgi:hypothetical protein
MNRFRLTGISLSGLTTYAGSTAAYASLTVTAPSAPGTMPAFIRGLVP